MAEGTSLDYGFVVLGGFLLLCILASKVSARLGVPALVFFIGLGMLIGSDGPGGVHFADFDLTQAVGSVALAFILFSGGLDTSWEAIRPVFKRGLALSTIGVVVTGGLIAAFSHYVLALPVMVSLLLGAVVSSTDAAAVFGVLKSSGARLKHNITPLLEFESGTNDPVAIFLTIGITQLIVEPTKSPWLLIPKLLLEMPVGVLAGFVVGRLAIALINRIKLEYDGLYPVITIATVCIAYGGAHLLGGNAFVSVYVAGLAMGSRTFLHRLTLIQFHDALAWVLQIVMFVVLGLLVFPKQLIGVALPGLALSAFLLVVARPVAVFVSLAFVGLQKRTKLFIAWAGLRGAVPIILATFPAIAGVPEAQTIFNLVFFIVLTSVVIQGTTLRALAKKLSVVLPGRKGGTSPQRASDDHLLHIDIEAESASVGRQIVELGLPPTALIVLLNRGGDRFIPEGATILEAGDGLLIATRKPDEDELRRRFE